MRSLLLLLSIGIVLGAAIGQPALIAGEGQGHESPAANKHAASGAAEESPGIFGWALDLAIWTTVVFLLLLWILTKFAWKPMLEGLQRREESIRAALDEAQRAREEAKTLHAQYEEQMNRTQEEVSEIFAAANRDAQSMKDEMITKAKSEIQTERDRLRHEIEMARDQALQQIWDQSARLATLISAKAIRKQLDVDDHRRLVDEAIAELREAGNERQREVANIRS